MNPKRIFLQSHQPIKFTFKQNRYDFIVEELPIRFSNSGNFMVLKIQKEYTSTWDLIHHISNKLNIKQNTIGYAGLKDKNSTSIQYISIPIGKSRDFKDINSKLIKVLETYQHNKQLQLGDLVANRFSITLKDVEQDDIVQIYRVISQIQKNGMPNYFGYQRFGEDSKSYQQGEKIAKSGKRLKGAKEKLLVSAYQSHLFNSWLNQRVNLSSTISNLSVEDASKVLSYPEPLVKALAKEPQFFKLFIGDMMMPYPYGKFEYVKDMHYSSKLFSEGKISPTGLICGSHSKRSASDAYHLEEPFDDSELNALKGDRRFAWIWPEDVTTKYNETKKELTVKFYLPKGSYATTFLEEIGKCELRPSEEIE